MYEKPYITTCIKYTSMIVYGMILCQDSNRVKEWGYMP